MIYNIAAYHNGFGDILQHSTLAERMVELGHEVRLYTGPDVMPFRNPELKRFLWDKNPFITGESKDNWNLGDIPNLPYTNTTNAFISNWEAMHGLEPRNILPKIYYRPTTFNTDIAKDGIIELSAISHKYNPEAVIAQVRKIIKSKGINFRQIFSDNQSNIIQLPEIPKVTVSSLEDLSDIIHNSKVFISLCSGTHSLAAAIQRFGNQNTHYCLIPEKDYDTMMANKKFIYPNIIYLKCG